MVVGLVVSGDAIDGRHAALKFTEPLIAAQTAPTFLRHDLDVILVGEIRDEETAASTGHLVLSTIHIGSVFGVFPRLRNLGLGADSIGENLVGVVNQRLVRRIWPHCRTLGAPDAREREWLGDAAEQGVWRGRGCSACHDAGYHGRLPVYELLRVGTRMAGAITMNEGAPELRRIALDSGVVPMHRMAMQRVQRGEMTVAEVLRTVSIDTV